MRHPMAKTHLATCRHEAAHAVVCERFGGRVLWVRALPTRRKDGVRGETKFGDMRKLGPVQWSVVSAAGSVAEHLWHGTARGLMSAHDLEDLKRMGMRGEDFRIIWQEAERVVRKLKPEIWRLAEQLKSGKRVPR